MSGRTTLVFACRCHPVCRYFSGILKGSIRNRRSIPMALALLRSRLHRFAGLTCRFNGCNRLRYLLAAPPSEYLSVEALHRLTCIRHETCGHHRVNQTGGRCAEQLHAKTKRHPPMLPISLPDRLGMCNEPLVQNRLEHSHERKLTRLMCIYFAKTCYTSIAYWESHP